MNGQSRTYLGIHGNSDNTQAVAQGRRVADYMYDYVFATVRKKR